MLARFTILATLLSLTASASAQPTLIETCDASTSTTCEPPPAADPLDRPWTATLAVGGMIGVPTAAEVEAGLRLGGVYLHAGLPWIPKSVVDATLVSAGIDGIFGKRRRGFAGAGMMISVAGDELDDDLVSGFARIGANAPISPHVSLRAWASLGAGIYADHCIDCEDTAMPVPIIMLHLAVAYRL